MIVVYLLDTTYILPFFGLPVDLEGVRDNLDLLLRQKPSLLAATTCSLIEGKWKAIREFQKTKNEAYLQYANDALVGLSHGKRLEIIVPWSNEEINALADTLLISGHTDYMDCWIAATAKVFDLIFVTEDESLRSFLGDLDNWQECRIINWRDFVGEVFDQINQTAS